MVFDDTSTVTLTSFDLPNYPHKKLANIYVANNKSFWKEGRPLLYRVGMANAYSVCQKWITDRSVE